MVNKLQWYGMVYGIWLLQNPPRWSNWIIYKCMSVLGRWVGGGSEWFGAIYRRCLQWQWLATPSPSMCGLVWLGQVTLHVQRQVIWSGKASFTNLTLERLSTGMFAVVSGQLVGPGKTPLAFGPMAAVWFFTWGKRGKKWLVSNIWEVTRKRFDSANSANKAYHWHVSSNTRHHHWWLIAVAIAFRCFAYYWSSFGQSNQDA